jgi:prepilin-type N-terminal cleavage/methylation domain-containing protein
MNASAEKAEKQSEPRIRVGGAQFRRGLTLIELIVVVAIIAILVAVIFPAIANSREAAYKTTAIKQLQQLGQAAALYSNDFDAYTVPSTNYGLAEDDPHRMWSVTLFSYAGNTKEPFIARGTNGQYPGSWKLRGWSSYGLNSATSIDTQTGCVEDLEDKDGCWGFTSGASITDKNLDPAMVPLFTTTPSGDTAENYRGYEFNPYNYLARSDDVRLSPPFVSDRDLVQEVIVLTPELLKAVYARYNSTGKDEGFAPIVFADSHAKVYSAKQIKVGNTGILWRFR